MPRWCLCTTIYGIEQKDYHPQQSLMLLVASFRCRRLLTTTYHCRPLPLPPPPLPLDVAACCHRPPPAITAMPAIGATDTADLEAKAWAERGFSLQLEQPRQVPPHPHMGGVVL